MALRRNPKSYGAWHHRKWILRQGLVEVNFDREYRLLDQLLKADARNFHGWNYRRFVTKLDNVPEVEELRFTMDMIDTNFSNYSAWHNRRTPLTERLMHLKDVLELFDDLIKLDPRHAGYYEDERSLVLMNQVTSDNNSFWSYYSHSSSYTSSKLLLYGCIQLKQLSLTRIGSVERLLWVQMLDLSHNKLRSMDGIEALQLLTCLNLSCNQISSFTALEPLKLLSYLRVLDISFNKIGAYSVDTTRYLFSSPLSHSMELDGKCIEDYRQAGINVADHWEVILLFRDLPLKQLDVKGNAVADEKFRDILKKVLPNLIWFDGERL